MRIDAYEIGTPPVVLNSTESVLVLNQGRDFLEGYLARKPKDTYESLEADLRKNRHYLKRTNNIRRDLLVVVQWDRTFTRGIVLNATGSFVDVFLLDYGIRECYSRRNLFVLPEKFRQVPAYGIRIELETPTETNLRDDFVTITCLERLTATSAKGSLSEDRAGELEPCAPTSEPTSNGQPHLEGIPSRGPADPGVIVFPGDVRLRTGSSCEDEERARERLSRIELGGTHPPPTSRPTSEKEPQPILGRPPNDLLLEMIGTRCFLTELLVMHVVSRTEMVCSHYPSLRRVRRALDEMNVLPSAIPHDDVKPQMLVLALSKGALHRGIIGTAPAESANRHRVEFIDLPGHTEAPLVYYAPTAVAQSAPRALMKVRLRKAVAKIESGDLVTLLCERVTNNTAHGYLVRRKNDHGSPCPGIPISKL
ncbi:uncharacterized protein LOC100898093 [Galendromus occidentalis]|uniref:Uncharacterized protein LOC100898093 n=1 Tax=Galendromus occidentalis TaxID=34638 RepID=A0AAJ7L620_9ACAR|nr:uncharacterized protein LOC100898093 [Galendromus occidentalis]